MSEPVVIDPAVKDSLAAKPYPMKKPDLLALPTVRYEPETRILTDSNCPGEQFQVTLVKPGPLDRARIYETSRRYIEEYVTGTKKSNGKVKENANLFPSLDGTGVDLDEDTAAEIGIMEATQPSDAPVRWNVFEIVLLIHKAPEVFEDWRTWALTLWRRDNRGNSE